jgi:hypothetical protein
VDRIAISDCDHECYAVIDRYSDNVSVTIWHADGCPNYDKDPDLTRRIADAVRVAIAKPGPDAGA